MLYMVQFTGGYDLYLDKFLPSAELIPKKSNLRHPTSMRYDANAAEMPSFKDQDQWRS